MLHTGEGTQNALVGPISRPKVVETWPQGTWTYRASLKEQLPRDEHDARVKSVVQ